MIRSKLVTALLAVAVAVLVLPGGALAELTVTTVSGEEFVVDVNVLTISRIEYNPGMLVYTLSGVVHPVRVLASDVAKLEFVSAEAGLRYNIVARHSGKCLDVSTASLDDGALLVQWTCTDSPHQVFSLVPAGGEYFRVVALHSSKCMELDPTVDPSENGAAIRQWTCSGADNQLWQLVDAGEGYFKLKNKLSALVMDVSGASGDDGAPIIQWTDSGAFHQQFELRTVE